MGNYSVLSGLFDIIALERITHIIWREKVFQPVRELAGIVHDDNGDPFSYDESNYLSYLFWCFWCLSVWVSGLYFLLQIISPKYHTYLRNVMAGSGLVLVGHKWLERIR